MRSALELCENKTYFLRKNKTGEEAAFCRFRFAYEEDAVCFWFEAEDDELISPFTQDNEDIWKGDAAEVFFCPDGDLSSYKEMSVSPFGVRFYGTVRHVNGRKRLHKEPPPFDAKTERTERGYRAEMRLPYAALEGFERSKAKLNAFCVDRRKNGRQHLYALNPTLCKTFHCPGFFL